MLHVNTGKVNTRCQDLSEVELHPIHSKSALSCSCMWFSIQHWNMHVTKCCHHQHVLLFLLSCFSSIPTEALQLVGRVLFTQNSLFMESREKGFSSGSQKLSVLKPSCLSVVKVTASQG